jgi:diguanylate cyclase (GGDEF)-like protein
MTRLLRFFRTLSLTKKIVSQVSLLSLLAVAISLILLLHLKNNDQAYNTLLNQDAQAAVLVTAALNDLNDASRLVFAVLTEQESKTMRAALAVLHTQQAHFHDKTEIIRSLIPDAGNFDDIHRQEVELFQLAASIIDAAARWRGDKALAIIHQDFDPLLTRMRATMEQMRNESVEHFQTTAQKLATATRKTLLYMALAITLMLIGIIGMTVWTSLTQIARPIQRLTASMNRLSQRDYSEHIPYTDGQDEVGQMAQALQLFQHNLQRTDYLEIAKAEAERLAHAKSAFLATMSHEIRTPLNAIIGLAQLSQRRPLSVDQQERIHTIQQAGEHLLGVINNILDFSKLEGHHLELEHIPFSAQQVLEDVRVLLSTKAAEKSLTLECLPAPEQPLLGDPLRIRQILLNFATNAIKFSEQGTVQLRLSLEEKATKLFLHGEVQDQGIGLSEAQIKGLFQPFHQADASISRHFGGTGLGLAISCALAELLEGSVGVQSQPGLGSTFWFRVAVTPAPADTLIPTAASTKTDTAAPKALEGLQLLIVDDNRLNRLVASELLAYAGIQSDQASDGQQAIDILEAAADGYYDLVLMDMMMPGLDGCQTTGLLRQNPRFSQLPIVALTANTNQNDLERCLSAGMNAVVPKPIDESLLWSTLLQHCPPATARVPKAPVIAGAAGKAPPEDIELASIPGFELGAAMHRLGNHPDLYLKLVTGFQREHQDSLTQVRQSLTDGTHKAATLALHSLKGMAATLGATDLAAAAAQAEAAVHSQQSQADLEPLLNELEAKLRQARAQLKTIAQHLDRIDPSHHYALSADTGRPSLTTGEPPAPPTPEAPCLLVVDDQPGNFLIMKQALCPDYQLITLTSGLEALAFCQKHPLPDLILLDILMSDMDGLEVCRHLKNDPLTADIPVLFITAQSAPEDESAALAAGGVDFISKPINSLVLRARIHTHLLLKAQQDRFRSQAYIDGLTNLTNRRRFDELLVSAWRNGQRTGQPLALMIIDIDHFKLYNDHYGHPAGDACLKAVSTTIAQHFSRAYDVTARYGGEEFACILPNTRPDGALAKAMGLCRSIAALALPHTTSPVASIVTASIGVAVFDFDGSLDPDSSPEQLLLTADSALYTAKHEGRNRAVLAAKDG